MLGVGQCKNAALQVVHGGKFSPLTLWRAVSTLHTIFQVFEAKLKETVQSRHLSQSSMEKITELALKNMHVRRGVSVILSRISRLPPL